MTEKLFTGMYSFNTNTDLLSHFEPKIVIICLKQMMTILRSKYTQTKK